MHGYIVRGSTGVVVVWAKILCRLALRDPGLRKSIILGAVLFRSLFLSSCVPGRLRNGPELVGSIGTRQGRIRHLNGNSPSY